MKHLSNDASQIPVIDLFAGPGGLGEGFSAFEPKAGRPAFDLRLSIEKDSLACSTLRLRRLTRLIGGASPELSAYVKGEITLGDLEETYARQAAAAARTVWQAELGREPQQRVTRRIRQALGSARDWILLGGPPCQAYSIAGRSRMKSTRPDFENDERHLLYRQYLRVVADHEPTVFVLENVKGLLTSRHGGARIVSRILDDLSAPAHALGLARPEARRYRLYALGQRQASLPWMEGQSADGEEYLLRAEEFGIPQMRHRLFIVGVRSDVEGRPPLLEPRERLDVGSVISDLPPIRSRLSREPDSPAAWLAAVSQIRSQDWMRRGSGLEAVSSRIRQTLESMAARELQPGSAYASYSGTPRELNDWYRGDTEGITHHEARAHMRSDLHRYLFASVFSVLHGRSPELQDFPSELRPAHRNLSAALDGGDMFNDRFRVQLMHEPSTTIVSHISKDGHYYIHPNPSQCRSLTVREAARLQTFPDSYIFEGNRTHQYHQIGNAVPPLLALAIAESVHGLLSRSKRSIIKAA
jgi:DNA (cytosine-5)-methyltransferase 1